MLGIFVRGMLEGRVRVRVSGDNGVLAQALG